MKNQIKHQNDQVAIKVLIAEDDKVTLEILKKYLRGWGYNIITADTGQQAWKILKKGDIHMAVLDWIMPGISGPEVCQKVRQEKRDRYTYLIMLTSKDNPKDIIQGLTAGADDYVTKPFNQLELKARLQTGKRIILLESQLLDTQNRLRKMAEYDVLTKLWNRRAILNILDEEIIRSTRQHLPLGVIMIDIDGFKNINDTHGHQAGDAVLYEIASRLKNNVRPYDKVGRYGGDELFIVLPNCNLVNLDIVGRRLQESINMQKVRTSQAEIHVTISLGGVSSESDPDTPAEKLISESDKALLKAKKKGRNCFIISKKIQKQQRKSE
ncbi:MAG: diguanylate cyclase [Candidatus Aminicenantes bacterium]|nr:diguanylate cyclase [Candidatus Aminicenantes bacterium]